MSGYEGCTADCAVPVRCADCGRDLPPRGRSVPLEQNIPSCCDRNRMELSNTRHIWSVDEIEPAPSPVPLEGN